MPELSKETLNRVKAIFPPGQHEEVGIILKEECGNNLPYMKEADQYKLEPYRLAALDMSRGNIDRLLEAVILAQDDRYAFLTASGLIGQH